MLRRSGLGRELQEAGFSPRTIGALMFGLRLKSLQDLRSGDWGSLEKRTGLVTLLSGLPNMGPKGLAEVQAFRLHGDARLAQEIIPTSITTRLEPEELAILDTWAARRGLRRSEALRTLLLAALSDA